MMRALCRRVAVVSLLCSTTTDVAPSDGAASGDFGVLVMAHGGTPEWNQAVLDAVQPLSGEYPIEVAFGMADAATIEEAVAKLEARGVQRIGVVRLFVSGDSWYDRTKQILGLCPGAPDRPPVAEHDHGTNHSAHDPAHNGHAHSMGFWRITTEAAFALSRVGLAEAPEMGEVLADRARALSQQPESEDVLILAHGPGDDEENTRWLAAIGERAEVVREALPFRRVQVQTLREDWPEKRREAEESARGFVRRAAENGGQSIVIPFRVQGFGPYRHVLQGLKYGADGQGLLPHPNVTRWIGRQIIALQHGPFWKPLEQGGCEGMRTGQQPSLGGEH